MGGLRHQAAAAAVRPRLHPCTVLTVFLPVLAALTQFLNNTFSCCWFDAER